jgi:polyhydroxybutyrate depolymerase
VRTLLVDGCVRTYRIHVPANYHPDKPNPTVLVIHGTCQDSRSMMVFSGMNDKSDQCGFIAVYPEGWRGTAFMTWNTRAHYQIFTLGMPDDLQYIDRLLDDLAEVVPVDQQRLYSCGFSTGAMFSYRLAIERPGRFAAVGSVAGAIPRALPWPGTPTSVIHIQGMADKVVRPCGSWGMVGVAFNFRSTAETIRIWLRTNCIPEEPTLVHEEPEWEHWHYGPGANNTEVELVLIRDHGHSWPGQKPPMSWILHWTQCVSANDLLWDFFQRHCLAHPPLLVHP